MVQIADLNLIRFPTDSSGDHHSMSVGSNRRCVQLRMSCMHFLNATTDSIYLTVCY